ncbi:MAG TPA: hypothetical protein VL832_07830 [Puia sp.]|jgi:hypothetical protein|nr:hypothetical protein [Puia sp.]
MPDSNTIEAIKTISRESGVLSGWALAVLGGSILILVSTSYIRPANKRVRLIYLLFVPGWFFFVYSMYFGDSINRRLIAAVYAHREDVLNDIGRDINAEFTGQMNLFSAGILTFVIWLIAYLLWWIFGDWELKKT